MGVNSLTKTSLIRNKRLLFVLSARTLCFAAVLLFQSQSSEDSFTPTVKLLNIILSIRLTVREANLQAAFHSVNVGCFPETHSSKEFCLICPDYYGIYSVKMVYAVDV